jgi:hypothetical protein
VNPFVLCPSQREVGIARPWNCVEAEEKGSVVHKLEVAEVGIVEEDGRKKCVVERFVSKGMTERERMS